MTDKICLSCSRETPPTDYFDEYGVCSDCVDEVPEVRQRQDEYDDLETRYELGLEESKWDQ